MLGTGGQSVPRCCQSSLLSCRGEVTLSLLCLRPHAALFSALGGVALSPARSAERTVPSGSPGSVCLITMGLERERADISIIMDEDEFNRSREPILSRKEKVYSAPSDRDPNDINAHLKVGFEDVIAEPASTHSFDKVWIGSNAVFELVKFLLYGLLTTLLAVPMAFILGVLFAVVSCVHVWLLMPLTQSFMMLLPSAQVVWRSVTDFFITPLFQSLGRSLSSVRVKTTET